MTIRILGIDPGSRRTGIGLITTLRGQLKHVHHGIVQTSDEAFPLRLKDIFDGVTAAIAEFKPDEAAVETVFLSKNPQSALKLGQARGAAICACVNAGLPVSRIRPRATSRTQWSAAAATRPTVQYMVGITLPTLQGKLQSQDAADALAVAITHAHMREAADRLGLPPKLFR